jgi:hypothetical protein
VHSVFPRTVNLVWPDGALVALHGPGPLRAPFAAALDRLPAPGAARPGDRVAQGRSGPSVAGLRVVGAGARAVDLHLRPRSDQSAVLARALEAMPPDGGAPALRTPRARAATARLAGGIARLDGEGVLASAAELVGLGEGLTPAGDDVLVGVLAVLHAFRPSWVGAFAPELDRVVDGRTTALGREFLRHAARGRFAETLLLVAGAPTAADCGRAAGALLGEGATSGADTLAGMRLAARALGEGCR